MLVPNSFCPFALQSSVILEVFSLVYQCAGWWKLHTGFLDCVEKMCRSFPEELLSNATCPSFAFLGQVKWHGEGKKKIVSWFGFPSLTFSYKTKQNPSQPQSTVGFGKLIFCLKMIFIRDFQNAKCDCTNSVLYLCDRTIFSALTVGFPASGLFFS